MSENESGDEEDHTGTIKPKVGFSAEDEVTKMLAAHLWTGEDKNGLIQMLATHSLYQRREILDYYQATQAKDLIQDLKEEQDGHFLDVVVAMLNWPADLLVTDLHDALQAHVKDEHLLVEILCGWNSELMTTLVWWYERDFGMPLAEALESDLPVSLHHLLKDFVNQGVDREEEEEDVVDTVRVQQDAQDLMSNGLYSNDGEEDLLQMITTRSYPHLGQVLKEYKQISQETIQDAIRDEWPDDLQDGLLAIVHRLEDPAGFFALRLKEVLTAEVMNHRSLIRLLVVRSEFDLSDIKESYSKEFEQSLHQAVLESTHGDYGRLLLAIVGD